MLVTQSCPKLCNAIDDSLIRALESRDITLLTKVHIVKAMVFPVVMDGYESWTRKKVEQ